MNITQLTIIFLVAFLTFVVGDFKQAIANPNLLVQTEARKPKPIPVSLPTIARVVLKNGGSRTAKVVGVNSQHITIKRESTNRKEDISNVTRIEFNENQGVWWPTSDGRIVIRGSEDKPYKKGDIRSFEVRVDGLVWENVEENAIEIKPDSVIQVDGKEGIPRPMWNITESRYVVSKMEFESERQTWIITATLQLRNQ